LSIILDSKNYLQNKMLKGKDESLNTPNNSNNNSNSNSSTPNGNDQIHKIDYKNACKNGVKT